jgi:hypothetical protein
MGCPSLSTRFLRKIRGKRKERAKVTSKMPYFEAESGVV